ncbi:MAG TPA: L,D-transpeptidase family protein [Trebonia sp.]|nr:L,D-transpeptidase family protein [Trebonia sp.]
MGAGRQAPLRLESISPAPGAADVNGAQPITVTYNQPLPANVPFPSISPSVPGSWHRQGQTAIFTPGTGFSQDTRVSLSVPLDPTTTSGTPNSAKAGTATGTVASATTPTAAFTTGSYSVLRLQEVLTQLGYLPFTWTQGPTTQAFSSRGSAAPSPQGQTRLTSSVHQQVLEAYDAPGGAFGWPAGYPAQLQAAFTPGSANVMTRGALMGFEADHNLGLTDKPTPAIWAALMRAAAGNQVNRHGYSYALVSESEPETLTIYRNGKPAFHSLANTGGAGTPTPIGTFPIYEKFAFQIMSGTNPGGSHYSDPVQWVNYFSGGAAIHAFPRGGYGYPQSLGCVELPYDSAKQAFPLLPYGTLVTVLPG